MPIETLSLRQLNRTLLHRQLLLERATITPYEAVRRLVALQAQEANPPYIGLWTRLDGFEKGNLTALLQNYRVVRAALLRSTLHLMTAEDHRQFQPVLQPALTKALRSFFGKQARSLDVEALAAVAKPFIEEAPRTTGEIRTRLLEVAPEGDGPAMAYAVRNNLPLVQVPPAGTWGSGSRPKYTTAEAALGPAQPAELQALFFRYLAAFGPASVMDFQAWVGMTRLKKPIAAFKPGLRVFRSETGEELLDLPDAPLPDPDTPAPVRFVPAYDNLILAHRDRNRIIADGDRSRVFLSAARVLPTVLIDGFVAGTWSTELEGERAVLTISPFHKLTDSQREALTTEGINLLSFVQNNPHESSVEFATL